MISKRDLELISSKAFQDELKRLSGVSPESLILNPPKDLKIPAKLLAGQLECREKVQRKCPSLLSKSLAYIKTSFEQSSGESVAIYKQSFMRGNRLADLSCGLGIDDLFLAPQFEHIDACDINSEVLEVTQHNFKVLGYRNVEFYNVDGLAFIKKAPDDAYDWVYVDPSRRDSNQRFFDLAQSEPNVVGQESLLLRKSREVCIKASPMIDLQKCKEQFSSLNKIVVVSVDGECKEVLLMLSRNAEKRQVVTQAVVLSSGSERNKFELDDVVERNHPKKNISEIQSYIYDPDAAVLKAGLTEQLAKKLQLNFFNPVVQYLTSNELVEGFPGRCFKVEDVAIFQKRHFKTYLKKHHIISASIMRKVFPLTPEELRSLYKLEQNKAVFLIFTTLEDGQKICLVTEKVSCCKY